MQKNDETKRKFRGLLFEAGTKSCLAFVNLAQEPQIECFFQDVSIPESDFISAEKHDEEEKNYHFDKLYSIAPEIADIFGIRSSIANPIHLFYLYPQTQLPEDVYCRYQNRKSLC
eukprot:GHVP01045476.1.p1 GENE.GHVP01045476.1~~GHVP01045476.1.p1  ORF type:complete len:115 (+),score=24.64 GHVP01045476.1:42-386(+)